MSDNDHLANLSDGAGCAEVWEHLSEQREADASDADSESDDESTADDEAADSAEDTDAEQEAAVEVPCP
jgi:hypothetical protein